MRKIRILIPFALALQALVAQSPVVKAVDPVYPPFAGPVVYVPVQVRVVIDRDGAPFSIESEAGLPDATVMALMTSAYQSSNNPYRISLTMAIPRLVESFRPQSPYRTMAENDELSDGAAAKLDREIESQILSGAVPFDDLQTDASARRAVPVRDVAIDRDWTYERQQLLIHAAHAKGTDANQLRKRQLLWLVKNRPDENVLQEPAGHLNKQSGQGADPTAYAEIKALWLDAVAKDPLNLQVLSGAVRFIMVDDPEQAESLLLPKAKNTTTAIPLLGRLYALSALGVSGLDLNSGEPSGIDSKLATSEFAAKSRTVLESATDIRLLSAAMQTISEARMGLAKAGPLPTSFGPLCESVVAKVRDVFKDFQARCDAPVDASKKHVVTSGSRKKNVDPVYPPAAKKNHIVGSLKFTGTVGPTPGSSGKASPIRDLEFLSGPLALYTSARDAVRQWTFLPFTWDGEPVDVETMVAVDFK